MFFVALLLSPFLAPDVKQDVETFLKKFQDHYKNQSIKADLSGNLVMAQMGMKMSFTGTMVRMGEKHARVNMDIQMVTPQGEMPVKTLVVWDGTTAWTENHVMGMVQVVKGNIEEMKAQGGQNNQFDMENMVQSLMEFADWDSFEEKGDSVVLKGRIASEKTAGNPVLSSAQRVVLEAHARDFVPMVVRYEGTEGEIMRMALTNPQPLSEEEKGAAFYSYAPPEGAMVMDVKDMPQMQ
jgi:hypothetical protein